MSELWQLGASETARRVVSREVSAVEVCRAALARLDAVNRRINAVVQRTDDVALAKARAVDDALARGEAPGALCGVPVTVKVNTDQKGFATTNGLRIQQGLVATTDSPVVSNLEAAGAVIVGRTNTPAFSIRWFTRNSLHGHTLNPVNPALTPGGSSGGGAAAVAAGVGAVAHGTDIGGSIRYPAYACGVQGLRPTLGRVAAHNASGGERNVGGQLMAVSGPMARSVADLQLAFGAMAARDSRDPWWTPAPLAPEPLAKRAALTVAPEGLAVAPPVEAALRDAADRLADAGWHVEEVECPALREPTQLQMLLWRAESERAYGSLVIEEDDRDANFVHAQLRRLAMTPDEVGILDALQRRATLLREWALFLDRYPVLVCPISAELPFPDQLDVESESAFDRVFEAQLTQTGLPLLGLPGLAVFTGMVDGGPCGAQLVAGRFREDMLFSAGRDIEARGPAVEIYGGA